MKRIRVRPAPGAQIFDPASKKAMARSGRSVVMNSYWSRLVASKRLVIVKDEEPPAKPKKKRARKKKAEAKPEGNDE